MGGGSSTPETSHPYKEVKAAKEDEDFVTLLNETNHEFNTMEKAAVHIALTGVQGAGKSSLINALRGLSDFDESAAEIDVIQVAGDPRGYPHPVFPDVTLWDLPGTGTQEFSMEKYLKQVNFTRYDFFILVSSERFTTHDFQLSHTIQKMGKRFCFVRSKMDTSIENEKIRPNFKEEATLQSIRKYCLSNLMGAGISSPEIFLVSSWYWDKYDFPLLQKTLENEIEDLKRRALIAEKKEEKRYVGYVGHNNILLANVCVK